MAVLIDIVGGKNNYSDKMEFICETDADVADLPTNCSPTSRARVIESGRNLVLNSEKKWKDYIPTSSEGGSTGSGSSVEVEVATDEDVAQLTNDVFGY